MRKYIRMLCRIRNLDAFLNGLIIHLYLLVDSLIRFHIETLNVVNSINFCKKLKLLQLKKPLKFFPENLI